MTGSRSHERRSVFGYWLTRVFLSYVVLFALASCGLADELARGARSVLEDDPATGMKPVTPLSAAAFLDGHEGHERVLDGRKTLYDQRIPEAAGGIWVSFTSVGLPYVPGSRCGPRDLPCGVKGSAVSESGDRVEIDPENPLRGSGKTTETGKDVAYSAELDFERHPEDPTRYAHGIHQGFYFAGNGHHTIQVTQVGSYPYQIQLVTYDEDNEREASSYFHISYRTAPPGTRLKLDLVPNVPLGELRLLADYEGDGDYEHSWAPEASMSGPAEGKDHEYPVTTATTYSYDGGSSEKESYLVALVAEDHIDGPGDPSGVAVTYYIVPNAFPRIYTGPFLADSGSEISFWSVDRAYNSEWINTLEIP